MNLGKESETLEFKKTTGEMKEAMVSISSILNKHGIGTLYFGVKPNGDIIGQDVSESSITTIRPHYYRHYYRNPNRRPRLPEKLQGKKPFGFRENTVKQGISSNCTDQDGVGYRFKI